MKPEEEKRIENEESVTEMDLEARIKDDSKFLNEVSVFIAKSNRKIPKKFKYLLSFSNKVGYLNGACGKVLGLELPLKKIISLHLLNFISYMDFNDSSYDFFENDCFMQVSQKSYFVIDTNYECCSPHVLKDIIKRIHTIKESLPNLEKVFRNELAAELSYGKIREHRINEIDKGFEELTKIANQYDLGLINPSQTAKWKNKFQTKPFLSHAEVGVLKYEFSEFALPKRVNISVKIKYNPDADGYKRGEAMNLIYKTNAKKIKNKKGLIETLKSISEHDPYINVKEIANKMISNYEKFGVVNPGQELQDMVNV
ncbi:hypothetical protein HOK51_01410 [Candidatus Woesearchaeota archaeon]|jgi:hypothetical protein|nr:hypothetical protein [Candidatus Woesearchaeota archaeon]MBT6518471.1 hypothetical protein [Candidatus Woesearchaeota archaeon]